MLTPSSTSPKRIIVQRELGLFGSSRFSSNFPLELWGIINPNDFAQTVKNINDSIRKTVLEKILLFLALFPVIIGIILLLLLSATIINKKAFIPVIVIGFVLVVLGSIVLMFVMIRNGKIAKRRVSAVLANESRKYSAKYGKLIFWKLEFDQSNIMITPQGIHTYILTRLVIEIHGGHKPHKLQNSASIHQPISMAH